jgi:phosphoribosylanthranilate isomerase
MDSNVCAFTRFRLNLRKFNAGPAILKIAGLFFGENIHGLGSDLMIETKIKVCGITTPKDAILCARMGVDYLGLVFEESPRKISLEVAREIRTVVPYLSLVGVFADANQDYVTGTARTCGLNMVQLNGEESPEYCRLLLTRTMLPIVKTLRPADGSAGHTPADYETTSFFLLDLERKNFQSPHGGLTEKLWEKASLVRKKGYRIFLGGNLNPSNVRQAVEMSQPFCVDVCHGVEHASGVMDVNALRWFMAEAKGCFV